MSNAKTSQGKGNSETEITPVVAATLTSVIYQARLINRQSKLNISEHEVVTDVVNLWHTVMDALGNGSR